MERAPVGGSPKPTPGAGDRSSIWLLHLTLAVGLAICAVAFAYEISRAIGGNGLSWAYVFEWPIFAGFAIYMWSHLRKEYQTGGKEQQPRESSPKAPPLSGRGASTHPGVDAPSDQDPALTAWLAYVRDIEDADVARLAEDDQPTPGAV